MHTQQMLDTHPQKTQTSNPALVTCIQACLDCSQTCNACADACLAEEMVADLRRCIRLNLDCADLCEVSARLLSRQTEAEVTLLRAQVEAMVLACRLCAEECERHADMHEHCRVCADACRRCEQACQQLLQGGLDIH